MSSPITPATVRKEREHRLRRADILETAEAVFADRGYIAATMEQIAGEAGFSVGSLYTFFKNKEDMYAEMLREKVKVIEVKINEAIALGTNPLDRLQRYFAARIDMFWEQPQFFRIYYHETMGTAANLSGGLTPDIQERYEEHLKTIEAIFSEGIDRGIFRDILPRTLTTISEGVIQSYTAHLSREEAPIRNEAEERQLYELFTSGLVIAS